MPRISPAEMRKLTRYIDSSGYKPATKRKMKNYLAKANNPDAGKIDVVLAQVEKNRQKTVISVAKQVNKNQKKVTSRAKRELGNISQADWDKMVSEANGE